MPATRTLGLGVIAVTLALAYGIWYAYSVILVALLRLTSISGVARARVA